jgi:hypothetical protein
MATLGTSYPTLMEISKQFTGDGTPLPVAELLTETNEALDDIPWVQANSNTGHRIAAETSLPDAVWRKLNQGVVPTKGSVADLTESVAQLASLGKVDASLADMSGDVATYRVRKNRRHMEGMNQKFMEALFYGDNTVNPEQFLGLSTRYSQKSAINGANIIDAGGTGTDNQSIWLVGWGVNSVYGIFPKGTQAGIVHDNYGKELALAPDGVGELPMYRDWFQWTGGIAVEDWRNVVRIANIDTSDLGPDPTTGATANLIDLMVQAIELLGTPASIRPVFYTSRSLRSFMRRQANNVKNIRFGLDDIAGRKVTTFDGIPVRRVDRLLATESRVV